ncbi:flavin reductase like domain-domain-containing protein [Catenaria anguillulae PL171]|uniref:Flavin reductase like domain-domain-containing protein n=1 Tax=Catenaria anguillulae PL171 TaxID=765915 RepID=A0A1Y2I175_9FUNG|nr:flavin reductase like domain-domain-containing protein [Catenaria anguillulae PL171]
METDFRLVMRQQAFPVCVVGSVPASSSPAPLTAGDAHPLSFRFATLSSFTSVSLTPPIISFALRDPSRIGDLILSRPDRRFTLHLLSESQAHLSQQFADPKTQTTLEPNVAVSQWLHGQFPILDGCLAVLECQADKPTLVGDHTMWFGKVIQVVEAAGGRKPLLYMDRKYTTTVAPAPEAKAIPAKHHDVSD